MNKATYTHLIKQKAAELGFMYCGVSKAEFLEEEAPRLERWLNQHMHGQMHYMENHFDKRLDPRLLVEGAKSVVSLLLSTVVMTFSDFKGTNPKPDKVTAYSIIYDTCLSYIVALAASAFVLWFFGRFENMSFWNAFAQCITLGVISSLGASAGRLLIK